MGGFKDQLGDELYFPAEKIAAVPNAIDEVPAEVRQLFEQFTFEVIDAGATRFSSDAVLHRIRWECQITRGQREFKCNDNWTPVLSRWFMAKHPQYVGFFETRKRTSLEGKQ